MATCAHCKTEETELYYNGVAICLPCADAHTERKPPATDQQIRATLLQDVLELSARTEQATEEFEAVVAQIPKGLSHADEVQWKKKASLKLSTARKELMKGYRRLDEHLGGGIIL